jgi:hypothetical protein
MEMPRRFAAGCRHGHSASHRDPLALNLGKAERERVKRASQGLLASIKARLAELDRFWEKEQTKADVEVFILDEVFASLPTPPFTPEENKRIAGNVYAHVWQQAMNGEFGERLNRRYVEEKPRGYRKTRDARTMAKPQEVQAPGWAMVAATTSAAP